MSELLLYYKRPDPTTWVYMSSFLTIGLYFVFHRFWSIRNLDIALLILLAPGLLMVQAGRRREMQAWDSKAIAAKQSLEESGLGKKHLLAVAYEDQKNDGDAPRPEPTMLAFAIQQAELDAAPAPDKATAGNWSDTNPTDQSLGSDVAPGINPAFAKENSPYTIQYYGFVLLFLVQFLILIRLLLDSMMNRRPLLHPNLTSGGLYFISISLFVFLMGNVVTSTPRMRVMQGPELGPGYALMHQLPRITTRPVRQALAGVEPITREELDPSQRQWTMIAKILAISAHLAIVCGIVLIGGRHFGNIRAGVGAATLYLLLPYTAHMTGRVDHALPAALLLWALLSYRKPLIAGVFFGLAGGLVYFPLFLLPLWISFYWRRGVRRFVLGVGTTLLVLAMLLSFGGTEVLGGSLAKMFGLMTPTMEPDGIWRLGWSPYYRIPVFVGFIILSVFFGVWPSPKNLGSLISCSAALMVAAQFCHGYGGGLFIAWFLPLLLLTIFRPNLQDRIAQKVVEARGAQQTPRVRAEVTSS